MPRERKQVIVAQVLVAKEQHVVAGKSRRKIARPAGAPGRLGLPAKIERGRGHPAQQLGSTISRAVIDDHGLLLAPDLAKRRVDAVPDALVGVIRGIRIGTSALM